MPTQCENPPSMSPRAQSVADMDGTWWVAQTRPQYEKKLARELIARGVDYFLPLVNVRRVYSGKPRVLSLPFFPTYVFVNGDAEARYIAACSPAVSVIRNVTDQPRLRRELIRVDDGLPRGIIAPDTDQIRPGIRCVVKRGHALMGCEGWIDKVTGQGHVTIAITILGQSRPVEIDAVYLEPV